MKHVNIFLSTLLLLLIGGVQTTMAQSDSNWENYARDPESIGENDYVYLYNVTQKQFLNSGGAYGMHGILNPRGIRLALESETVSSGLPWSPTYTTYYYLKGPIVNDAQGSYLAMVNDNTMGDVIYIDRAKDNDARFTIETIGGGNTFRIHNARNSAYWTYDTSKNYVTVTSRERDADVWCLISIEDYRTFTQEQAHVGDYNVSGLLYNTRFIRNVSDPGNHFWATEGLGYSSSDYCTAIDSRLGTNSSENAGNNDSYAREYGSYGCLEIGRATGRFYQEVSGLNPGLYKVSAQAFFDGKDSAPYTNGAYGEPNTASETNAYLFANDSREPIPMLTDEQYSEFMNLVDTHHAMLDDGGSSLDGTPNNELFRRNVPASQYMTGNNTYSPDESRFVVEVYVMVGGDGTLRLGVGKNAEGGRVYMDNMTLTYMGNPQTEQYGFGVDAYGNQGDVDPYKYTKDGYMFYLSRKFVASTEGHGWNALTLPVNLSASQLREAFGNDMELVKLTGLNPQNDQQIFFEPVNLDGGEGLEAGQCYLVKVTKDPIAVANSSYQFKRIDESKGDAAYANVETVTYQYGSIYQFLGVACPEGISRYAVTGTTADGKLNWTSYYYHPEYAPAGSYVMSGGDMYHLTGDWDRLIGTAWYITETTPSSESKTFVIDNGNGTTDINGIVTEMPAENAVEGIYNINGQKVASDKSLNDLPKGIYIVNGKKYIVK